MENKKVYINDEKMEKYFTLYILLVLARIQRNTQTQQQY